MDMKGCQQHDERGWKRLSKGFRGRIERMIEEAQRVEMRYAKEVG